MEHLVLIRQETDRDYRRMTAPRVSQAGQLPPGRKIAYPPIGSVAVKKGKSTFQIIIRRTLPL